MQAKILFRLGGDSLWSRPLVVDPAFVISVEPYERAGKAPKVPRCTVGLISGERHRVYGSARHVMRWLGWESESAVEVYKAFLALRDPPQFATPSSVAAAEPTSGVTDGAVGKPVDPPVNDSAPDPLVNDSAPSCDGAIPTTDNAPPIGDAPPAETGVDEL
jgi:hypothetical protein